MDCDLGARRTSRHVRTSSDYFTYRPMIVDSRFTFGRMCSGRVMIAVASASLQAQVRGPSIRDTASTIVLRAVTRSAAGSR